MIRLQQNRIISAVLLVGLIAGLAAPMALGQNAGKLVGSTNPNQRPAQLQGVGIDEKLGAAVNLDLEFTDESGRVVPLRRYFSQGRPVILDLVYYSCPMLCNLVLNGQTSSLREVAWTPGKEFEVVTISIDPTETPELAAKKKQTYLAQYDRPAPGWHFLTDYAGNVKKLADQVGFRYRRDGQSEQYAHMAAIMFLTPDGRVSRYLYGIKFAQRNIRLALTEAGEGKTGTTIDKFLMFCYQYDAHAKGYVPVALNIMKIGGGLMAVILGAILLFAIRWERKRGAFRKGPYDEMNDDLVTAK
jgi:protein SCO1/2